MTDLFLSVLRLSASASIVAAAVLLTRLLLKKAPKWLHAALWAMVAVRLILPVSIESRFSRMPEPVVGGTYVEQFREPVPSEAAAEPLPSGTSHSTGSTPVNEAASLLLTVSWLWAAGMTAMGVYTAISYFQLKQMVSDAVHLRDNVFLSRKIPSPFVLGIVKPRIYLPARLDGSASDHVLAHERAHIRRGDHLWKPLGFLLLSIHWFNPLMWLCYILLCRDIELACDERVVKTLDEQARADYSQALLDCAVSHRTIAACPIAFGEVGVRQRVKNVLSYKKPGFWILLVSVILCVLLAVSFLTDPVPKTDLMDKVMAQDGYCITGQESKTINLVINKDSITEESFSAEGCHYSPGVVVPYHTMTDNMLYLKHVCLAGDWLKLTFDFADSEYKHGQLLLPWSISLATGNQILPATENISFDVWDNQNTYKNAATLSRTGNGRMFSVKVNYSVYQQAEHHIAFALEDFTLLHYIKGQQRDYVNEDPLSWLKNLSADDLLYLEYRAPSASPEKQYTLYNGEKLEEAVAVLTQFDSRVSVVPEITDTVGSGYEISIEDAYGLVHTLWNDGNTGLYIDGKYYEDSYDILNNVWDYYFAGTGPLPQENNAWGLTASLSDITATGMRVSYTYQTAKPVSKIATDYRYRLETQTDGIWQELDNGGKAIRCSIAPGATGTQQDISTLDWSDCYGPLPNGIYRMAVDFYMPTSTDLPLAFRTLYAEFYIGDTNESALNSFFIFPTEVTSVGMTVLNLPDGAWQSMDVVTELNYYLEQEINGQWVRLEPHSEEGLPIGDKTIHTVIDADTDRHLLDWSTLYGVLPSGSYRVGIDYYFREKGISKTLYANFTIDDAMNPASFLSTMTADSRRCSAEFPPNIRQQYVFSKKQDAQLISILNRLQPQEFFVGAAVNPKVVVNISHSASPVWLYWDGQICQFSFSFDHTRWAVRNQDLNDFFEQLLRYSPENSTYSVHNVAPLNELTETYTLEEAIIDQVVVINEGSIRENNDVWEQFILSTNARIPSEVRIMKTYSSGSGLKAVKNLYDLEFDGDSYYLHYPENGTVKTAHYHYLWSMLGQTEADREGNYREYSLFCLSNEEPTVFSHDFRENDRFAKPGDDPFMVWCNDSLRQKSLPIPDEITKITLEVDLQPYITVTDPGIIAAIELIFSEAEACTAPKNAYPGPVLRFHSSDGVDLYLQLDLEKDLCTFNDQFYDYGKGDHSVLQGLWKLLDLDYWPDEIMEHDAFSRYFDQLPGRN